ncbi:hypothetical protein CEUSTIGMA_g2821.t1 [Chlamydomonas eustigma]|uniref:CRC domain-containing protein n=1 Tax=Chlamydomonas eustigma TaxID=1157962 RepID=A0A250WX17_9CHLO|nr:hypothetical protein CEUSTIGMA_g2821.t1 [Chlamydomonas eustigma]|eukprot:GAX75377.1 hypothetical protein CEUSTIGMA_g2821.t1 [Chlamydomonas eustigma]
METFLRIKISAVHLYSAEKISKMMAVNAKTAWGQFRTEATSKLGFASEESLDFFWEDSQVDEADDKPIGCIAKDGDMFVIKPSRNSCQSVPSSLLLSDVSLRRGREHEYEAPSRVPCNIENPARRKTAESGSNVQLDATISGPGVVMGEKRCTCQHSRCIKLYCVCWAAGNICKDCSCRNCMNTPDMAADIRAEQPKPRSRVSQSSSKGDYASDGEAQQKPGCRCRKSRCVKKYCECFDAGAPCKDNCRCTDCQNTTPDLYARSRRDDSPDRAGGLDSLASAAQLATAGYGTEDARIWSPHMLASVAPYYPDSYQQGGTTVLLPPLFPTTLSWHPPQGGEALRMKSSQGSQVTEDGLPSADIAASTKEFQAQAQAETSAYNTLLSWQSGESVTTKRLSETSLEHTHHRHRRTSDSILHAPSASTMTAKRLSETSDRTLSSNKALEAPLRAECLDPGASTEVTSDIQPTSSVEGHIEQTLSRPSSFNLPPRAPSYSRGNSYIEPLATQILKASSTELTSGSVHTGDGFNPSQLPEDGVMMPFAFPASNNFPASKRGPIMQRLYKLHQDRLAQVQEAQDRLFTQQQSAAKLALHGSQEEVVQSSNCLNSRSASCDISQPDPSLNLPAARDALGRSMSRITLPESLSDHVGSASPSPVPLPHTPWTEEGFGSKPWGSMAATLLLPTSLHA